MKISNRLSFIHISDIHFNNYSGDAYDIDEELKEAMLDDIIKLSKSNFQRINGILVCGDIAFSGKKTEYDIAKKFLDKINSIFKLEDKDIFCVAGNHDVDQAVTRDSRIVEELQNYLINLDSNSPNSVDSEIRKIQTDTYVQGILYKSIDNYNSFTKKMASDFTVENPNWETTMSIDEKYTLAIYGLDSVLVSGYKDHLTREGEHKKNSEKKMLISRNQIPHVKENIIYMSLCHHPPEDWNNQDMVEMMNKRVKIQLYGHKHIQNILSTSDYIKISSGALNPERDVQWLPRYNWLKIYIEKSKLVVEIYPRVYEEITGKFVLDKVNCDENSLYKKILLDLDHENELNQVDEVSNNLEEVRKTDVKTKEIVYRYVILNNEQKRKVLKKMFGVEDLRIDDIDNILNKLNSENEKNKFLEELRRI